jgi:sulfite reductase alpha subunit-like flavoprotein
MRKEAAELGALIEAGAYVFVCGDGNGMAKDVHAALIHAIQEGSGVSEEEATSRLAAMTAERRYVRDVWSS